jgi:[protein-PII] uridylyltransferase
MKHKLESDLPVARNYRGRVLAHAQARLSVTIPADDFARSLRAFLKIENRRLRIWHELGGPGAQIAASRAFVLDIAVKLAFDRAGALVAAGGAQNSCALLAVGGYGRAELAPFSDIDLVFLYSSQRLSEMKLMSESLLRLLWDAGLTIGHSFRTTGDCVTAALDDAHLWTALVHTRLLAGNEGLRRSLREALERDRRRRVDSFLTAVRREHDARYAKFGAVVCAQEPNVKESAGGLRDYHTALWLAHARYGYTTLSELRAHNLVAEREAQKIINAHNFLWQIRHATHFMLNRKHDRLSLDLQPALAKKFGYRPDEHSLGSERLMRDYYRHARELKMFSETMLARLSDNEATGARFWRKGRLAAAREPFSIRNARLHFDGDTGSFHQNVAAIFNAFSLAQAARVPFGFRLRESLDESIRALSPDFCRSPAVSAGFLKLLRRRGRAGYILRLMHEVGFLTRLVPEFARIRFLVQHDLYHHYTVDEHTLRALETLDALHNTEDRSRVGFRNVLEEIPNPALLHLALLLHDIGKGRSGGHVSRGTKLAAKICSRLQLKEADAHQVVLLVNRHVTMSHIAQRRDLNETRVIAEFARAVESLDVLNMLLLLTYADLNAVGPGVWSDWKASLLWDLYRRTRMMLTGTDTPVDDVAELAQYKQQIATLAPSFPLSDIERHVALLPDRYRRITPPEVAATHLSMAAQAGGERVEISWDRQNPTSTKLTVCAADRHALFADMAGTLAAHGVEILSAELNTREDGIAIDEFILRHAATRQAIEVHYYQKLEAALRKAAAGELNVAAMIERWESRNAPRKRRVLTPARWANLPRVLCDNEMSPAATIIEVHALDEPGLAHKIATVLAGLGLEIVCARIATERSDALDVFYVTDSEGEKLSDEAIRSVESQLSIALTTPDMVSARASAAAAGRGHDEKSRSDYQATFA